MQTLAGANICAKLSNAKTRGFPLRLHGFIAVCLVGVIPWVACTGGDSQDDTAPVELDRALGFEEGMERFWAQGFPDPFALRDQYQSFLGDGDELCPENQNGMTTHESCTSDNGTYFYGFAFFVEDHEFMGEPGYVFAMHASFEYQRKNEASFYVAGGFGFEVMAPPDRPAEWMAFMQGSFEYPLADGWLGDGVSSGLAVRGVQEDENYTLRFEGGSGTGDTFLYWDEVSVSSDQCNGYPVGRIGMRGEDTEWTWWQLGDSCDGCGELTYADNELGTYCYDIRPEINKIAAWVEVR